MHFSKQENKKNKFINAAKLPAPAVSNSSFNHYDKVKSSINNPISSSMTSFPKRAPSIPERHTKGKHANNQYEDDEY